MVPCIASHCGRKIETCCACLGRFQAFPRLSLSAYDNRMDLSVIYISLNSPKRPSD
jgi:hypothetical protein